MSIRHNFLRMYRRKSKLTQGDVAFMEKSVLEINKGRSGLSTMFVEFMKLSSRA